MVGERILIPEFEIVTHPRINLDELKKRHYSMTRYEDRDKKVKTSEELEEERITNKTW